MPDPLLSAKGLTVAYGGAVVLTDVSLQVAPGAVTALVGRNGAGKSTTLKALMGLVPLRAGRVTFVGEDISNELPHRRCRLGLSFVPEERRIFAGLTVEENLEVGRRPPRPDAPFWDENRLFDLFPNLAERRHQPAGRLSGGEQQMLAIARSLMGNPRLVLMDEPSEGVAPVIVERLGAALGELKREGLSLLLGEQNLGFAATVSDQAVVLETGAVTASGTFAALSGPGGKLTEALSL